MNAILLVKLVKFCGKRVLKFGSTIGGPTAGLLLIITLFSGCVSASGPFFGEVRSALTPRKGYGLVVIYRKPGLGMSNPVEYLFANNVLLPGRLPTGGFYTYEAAPGPLNVAFADLPGESTAATKTAAFFNLGAGGLFGVVSDIEARRRHGIDITVLPDQVIYLNLDTPHDWHQVTEQEATPDLQKCHWENAPPRGS